MKLFGGCGCRNGRICSCCRCCPCCCCLCCCCCHARCIHWKSDGFHQCRFHIDCERSLVFSCSISPTKARQQTVPRGKRPDYLPRLVARLFSIRCIDDCRETHHAGPPFESTHGGRWCPRRPVVGSVLAVGRVHGGSQFAWSHRQCSDQCSTFSSSHDEWQSHLVSRLNANCV